MSAPATDRLDALADRLANLLAPRLAELVAEAVANHPVEGLIDAREVARRLNISRSTVYERSAELGAVRIGEGPRAHLRFDPARVDRYLDDSTPSEPAETKPNRSHPRRRSSNGSDLLLIRGRTP